MKPSLGFEAKRYPLKLSRDVAQLGRAPRSGRGGRGFESRHPDHFYACGQFLVLN
jgi:hypothetical protein